MKYYRRTATGEGPIDSVGYGMFVKEECREQIISYGEQEWVYDDTHDKNCMKIEDIKEDIISRYIDDVATKRIEDYLDIRYLIPDEYYVDEFASIIAETAKNIADSYDPDDIVESAAGFDDLELTFWLWERVLEPKEINAIITNNGAVVFGDELINRVAE